MDEYRIKGNYDFKGEELRNLFLTNPEHQSFKSLHNIKNLLNFLILRSNKEAVDKRIIDYCINYLKGDLNIDVHKKEEYHKKFMTEVEGEELRQEAIKNPDSERFNTEKNLNHLFSYQMRKLDNKNKREDREMLLFALRKSIWLEKLALFRFAVKKVSAAAIIILCLFMTEMVSRATGGSIFTYVVNSVQQTMDIYFNNDNQAQILSKGEKISLEWIPDGYVIENNDKIRSNNLEASYYFYSNHDSKFTFKVIEMKNGSNLTSVEINDDVELITLNGEDYFVMKNLDRNKIIWYRDTNLYVLEGTVNLEIMKETIIKNFGGN